MRPSVGDVRLQLAREPALELELQRVVTRTRAVRGHVGLHEIRVRVVQHLQTQQATAHSADVRDRQAAIGLERLLKRDVPLHRERQTQVRIGGVYAPDRRREARCRRLD